MAVLLDASVVRLILVPAIMRILGRANWWPDVRRPMRATP
jgi:RND superfamily putative drug exporter